MSEPINEAILQDYQIFDVRTKEEWQQSGVIKDAILLTLTLDNGSIDPDFVAKFEKLADKSKEIAFVCAAGHRSSVATHLIKSKLGLDTTNLKGGMHSLIAQGYKTVPYRDLK
ncbi:rhodanese-like domain-containing protein [Campylobacter troglodytis]|uniref:rhodanese-like domain-containing protein n=1 Tax=Campylobacter troglodytis TaxID=654363 RepID=UPI00115B471D|nr:rhodanese-like domain-containing protein [Campylobacter troglodytis]